MGKKKQETKEMNEEKERIVVSIYKDEYETVKEFSGIEEVTSKSIRNYFGLNPTHRSRVRTELNDVIKGMTREEREEWLKKMKGEE